MITKEINERRSDGDRYAWTVKVGEKGQFVIPKEARDVFGINPGDTLLLLGDKARGMAIIRQDDFKVIYDNIFGMKSKNDDEDVK